MNSMMRCFNSYVDNTGQALDLIALAASTLELFLLLSLG